MSDGIKSGVNWIRAKVSDSDLASVEIISVLARPGTPSRMQCPPAKSAINSCSMTSSCPTMTFPSSARILACIAQPIHRGQIIRPRLMGDCAARQPFQLIHA